MSPCNLFLGSNLTNSDISCLFIVDEIVVESTVIPSHGKYKKIVNQDTFLTGKLESENGSADWVGNFQV